MPTYLPWLDLLRFVACVLVILSHLNPFPQNPEANHFGHNGVGLFFSISGYLIGSVLINGRQRPDWLSRFYANRLLRIYPPLLVGLVFFGALLALGFGNAPGMWDKFVANLPYYLTFTAQLSPTQGDPYAIVWTLCVEEYFYLLLPLAFWLVGTRWTAAILTGVIIVTCEPGLRMLPGTQFGTWFLIPVNLLTGTILAILLQGQRESLQWTGTLLKILKKRLGLAHVQLEEQPWVGFLGLGLVVLNGIVGWFHPFGPVMGLVTTITVWSFAVTRMPVRPPLNWLVLCGKWSYGIYLVHLPFCSAGLRAASKLGLDQGHRALYVGTAALIATVGSTVLAALIYYAVERPVLTRRSWVTDRPWARQMAAALQVSLVPAGLIYAAWYWH